MAVRKEKKCFSLLYTYEVFKSQKNTSQNAQAMYQLMLITIMSQKYKK